MIKSKARTTEKSKVTSKEFIKILEKFKKAYVTIGIHRDAGAYTEGAHPPDVVEVALWNEFGTEHIPERAFFRTALSTNESLINEWREEAISNVVFKGWPLEKAMDMVGLRVQILIQNQIKSNMPPPNEEKYAEWKRKEGLGGNTLMATQLMLRSVTYKVVVK